MSILLLGGTGFLGQAITRTLLYQKKDFVILTRDPNKLKSSSIKTIIGNLLDFSKIDLSPYKQIINCAGEIHNEALMPQINTEVPLNCLKQYSKGSDCHWIQVSSVGVYGKPKRGVITEKEKHDPLNTYEVTKSKGEIAVEEYCVANKVNYTIIRPSNVFGVGMPNQSLTGLIHSIKKNRFFYMGDPTRITMNYVSVEDVANLVCHCLDNEKAYNQDFIISDYLYLSEFVSSILEMFSCKQKIRSLPENLARKIAMILKFIPSFPLTESRIDALTSSVIYSNEKVKNLLDFDLRVGIKKELRRYCNQFSV